MGKFSMNRVVAILHIAVVVTGAVALFLATINHSLPAKWQTAVAGVAGVVGAIGAATVVVIKYLDGSQKFDALVMNASTPAALPSGLGDGTDPNQWLQNRPGATTETPEQTPQPPAQQQPGAVVQPPPGAPS